MKLRPERASGQNDLNTTHAFKRIDHQCGALRQNQLHTLLQWRNKNTEGLIPDQKRPVPDDGRSRRDSTFSLTWLLHDGHRDEGANEMQRHEGASVDIYIRPYLRRVLWLAVLTAASSRAVGAWRPKVKVRHHMVSIWGARREVDLNLHFFWALKRLRQLYHNTSLNKLLNYFKDPSRD